MIHFAVVAFVAAWCQIRQDAVIRGCGGLRGDEFDEAEGLVDALSVSGSLEPKSKDG